MRQSIDHIDNVVVLVVLRRYGALCKHQRALRRKRLSKSTYEISAVLKTHRCSTRASVPTIFLTLPKAAPFF